MRETLITVLNMNDIDRQQYLNQNGDALLNEMILHIGYPEDELRDKLNYRLFIELLSQNLLSSEQLKKLAGTLINEENLFVSIGKKDTDDVFTRSFSALWLTGLLHADRQLQFLTQEEATRILQAASNYLSREKDIRGFVDAEKGWAHAVAHGADLASAIVSHPSFELRYTPVLLQGVKDSFWKGSVFVDDEEERLVTIIEYLINKNIPEELFIEWVEQVFDKLQFYLMEEGYTPDYFSARTNTLHFMKTLYFALKFSNQMPELRGIVSLFIGKWMKQ